MVGHAHELQALVEVDAERSHPVDRDPAGDRALVADRLADDLQRLQPEPRAVLERAAILVAAAVVVGREELPRQVGVRAVDVDDVEPGRARPASGIDPLLLRAADVALGHRPRYQTNREVVRDLGGSGGRQPRLAVLPVSAGV